MTASPAIFFHSDAIEGEGKDLVGRRSAGQSFLKGFLAHVPGEQVHALVGNSGASKAFETAARSLGETRPLQVSSLRGSSDWTGCGTVFFPGPGFIGSTWRRQHFSPNACSLVGITHTVSTRRVTEALHDLMMEPVEPWDAIICTSRAVHDVVKRQMDLRVDYVKQRFGATRVPMPQLPIIPLGIHAADFTASHAKRAAMRARFGASDEAVVIMTMGRLTAVEKANPVPLYMAVEEVAQTTGKPVHLWMVGWTSREAEEELHKNGQARCPSVKVTVIDGRDADIRQAIWSGADIFTLPVDNIQETFGLVPVEAMAAGLPVVMPDWNGFRDTVVHGETGYLIPTAMPPPGSGMGARLARRFADGSDGYLQHLSLIQQQTAIDQRAYVAALTGLAQDAGLRKSMGAAGRQHVAATFDWSAVIPHYLALAEELAAMRSTATATTPRPANGPISPIEVDPFDLYRGYPTQALQGNAVVHARQPLTAQGLENLDRINGRVLYQRKMFPDKLLLTVAAKIAALGAVKIADLAKQTGQDTGIVISMVLFLAKYDFVTLDMVKPK